MTTLTGQIYPNGDILLLDGRYLFAPPNSNGSWERAMAENASGQLTLTDYEPPQNLVKSFISRDLLALINDDDRTKIGVVISANTTALRIWEALLGQGDAPIETTSDRCIAGWSFLTIALGEQRVIELKEALGI